MANGEGLTESYLKSEISLLPSRNKKWSLRAAALFPNSYAVGMSNLGFLTLFEVMHHFPMLFPQRFFYKPLLSIEERAPLSFFPIIAASISYEMDYLRLVSILQRYDIQLQSQKRQKQFLLVGGAAPSINPYPMKYIADAVFCGTGRKPMMQIMEILAENPPGLVAKHKLLDMLSTVPGMWIPLIQDTPPKCVNYDESIPPSSAIISSLSAFPNMVLVLAQTGCPFHCPFCATPIIYNPASNFSVDGILSRIEPWGKTLSRVGLVGSAIAEHHELPDIMEELALREIKTYISSIRLDRIDDRLLSILGNLRQRTISFAPETASSRLKKDIHKNFSADDIVRTISRLGAKEIKLYYMIGLPGEIDDDIDAIGREIVYIADKSPVANITISMNAFIPKRGTPWGNENMCDHATLLKRLKIMRTFGQSTDSIRLDLNYKRRTRLQWTFSCGDEKISTALINSGGDAGKLSKSLRELGWNV